MLAQWETGKKPIPMDMIKNVVAALGKQLKDLSAF
jgi:hypothetical protein